MKAHFIVTHLQVPRSRLSAKVKVKYQGHVSQKMGVSGALVFHKHILLNFYMRLSDVGSELTRDLDKMCVILSIGFLEKTQHVLLTHYQTTKLSSFSKHLKNVAKKI